MKYHLFESPNSHSMNVSQPNSHYIQILCLETERQLIVTRKISQNIGLITLFNILRSRKDMSCTLDPGVEFFFLRERERSKAERPRHSPFRLLFIAETVDFHSSFFSTGLWNQGETCSSRPNFYSTYQFSRVFSCPSTCLD